MTEEMTEEARFTEVMYRIASGNDSFLELANTTDINTYHDRGDISAHMDNVLANTSLDEVMQYVSAKANDLLLLMDYFYMVSDILEGEDGGMQEHTTPEAARLAALFGKLHIDFHMFLAVYLFGRDESGRRWLNPMKGAIAAMNEDSHGYGIDGFNGETNVMEIIQGLRRSIHAEVGSRNENDSE